MGLLWRDGRGVDARAAEGRRTPPGVVQAPAGARSPAPEEARARPPELRLRLSRVGFLRGLFSNEFVPTVTEREPSTPAPGPRVLRILLCDHRGAGLARRLAPLEATGYALDTSSGPLQSLRKLGIGLPAAILIDPQNPSGTVELEALEAARGEDPPAPVLVIADPADPLVRRRIDATLERGLWDVIARDAPLEELRLRFERLLDQARVLRELAEWRHRASHDDRTDLLRPLAFQDRLREHFSAAGRHGLELALVLVDMDKFGQINKLHDHTIGDTLIARVGEAVKRTIRTEDVAGRLGGDEFAVILPYTGPVDAARVVNRLRDEIRRLSGPIGDAARGVELEVHASLGFETFDGKDLRSLDALRRHAEIALRAAKVAGGDRAVYYREHTGDPAPARKKTKRKTRRRTPKPPAPGDEPAADQP